MGKVESWANGFIGTNQGETILMVGEFHEDGMFCIFRFGNQRWKLTIRDNEFLAKVKAGTVQIHEGDALHVLLRTDTSFTPTGELGSQVQQIRKVLHLISNQQPKDRAPERTIIYGVPHGHAATIL